MIIKVEKSLKALADKSRLRIINMLGIKSMCVCEITQVLKLSQSTVSGHLRVLKEAELVEDEKDGLWVEYRLNRENRFNSDILDVILDALKTNREMGEDREAALRANREVICKK